MTFYRTYLTKGKNRLGCLDMFSDKEVATEYARKMLHANKRYNSFELVEVYG